MTVSLPKTTSRHVTSLSHYVPPAAVRGNHVYVDWFPSTQTSRVSLSGDRFSQSQTFETHFSYHSKGNPKPMWDTLPLLYSQQNKTS